MTDDRNEDPLAFFRGILRWAPFGLLLWLVIILLFRWWIR